MNDNTHPASKLSVRRILLLAVPLAIAAIAGIKLTATRIIQDADKHSEETMLRWFELTSPSPRLLDARFTDSDSDLVADTPQDPNQTGSPGTLRFCYIAGPDAKEESAAWQDLAGHLSRATGKPVEVVWFQTTKEQLEALNNRSVHIMGFNTGAVPTAVATCGFVPVVTFGKDDGTFGITMQFIVPAYSGLQRLGDLQSLANGKKHSVTFTTADSNTGCKAALALLRDNDLLPYRDYLWKFSGSHEESIKGIASGHYDAAPVASDLLQRDISNGVVKAEDIRSLYESEKFPPATLGYAYYLSAEIAASIRQGLEEFRPTGTSLEKQFATSGTTRFVPISYKQDFALIRRIDDAFRKPAPNK